MGDYIDIAAADGGSFKGYLASSDAPPRPGIVLIQEIFGVNEAMRRAADTFSGAGYNVLVPDLFWRMEPGIELGYNEADFAKARDYMGRFDVDQGIKDIGTAAETLRGQESCDGKIAALGFCLGGRLAYLSAARLDIDAAVSFYGVRIHEHLDEAGNVSCPMLLHFAELDQSVPIETVGPIRDAFTGRRDVEIHIYPGAGHGFFNRPRDVFNEEQAAIAYDRTLKFLESALAE